MGNPDHVGSSPTVSPTRSDRPDYEPYVVRCEPAARRLSPCHSSPPTTARRSSTRTGAPRGTPVILSHGWPLNADAWEAAALYLANNGHRAIAHDRRGHGRSSQTWHGTRWIPTPTIWAKTLIVTLDLTDVTLIGHSTGGGEIVRYIGRHGTRRVAKLGAVRRSRR